MSIFDEAFRTIMKRGIVFTKDQMNTFRIKEIYNSVGDPEYMNNSHAEEVLENFNKRGEFCLLEATDNGKIYKMSLITFEDIWSRNVFALMNREYYDGFPDLITLYN